MCDLRALSSKIPGDVEPVAADEYVGGEWVSREAACLVRLLGS